MQICADLSNAKYVQKTIAISANCIQENGLNFINRNAVFAGLLAEYSLLKK